VEVAHLHKGVLVDAKDEVTLYDSVTAQRSQNDEEKAKFCLGQKVKLLVDVNNDGTYPHAPVGALMMPKDSIGYIKKIGEFLQVVRVYEVHFLGSDMDVEVVGCREIELQALEPCRDELQEELEALKAHQQKMNQTNKE
jgi:nitrogen fixation protein NifZ